MTHLSVPTNFGISEEWDPRPGTVDGTRNPRPSTHLVGETREPRPETLNLGAEIRDPGPNSQVEPEI